MSDRSRFLRSCDMSDMRDLIDEPDLRRSRMIDFGLGGAGYFGARSNCCDSAVGDGEYACSESDSVSDGSKGGNSGGPPDEPGPVLRFGGSAGGDPSICGRRVFPDTSDTLIRGTPSSSPSSGIGSTLLWIDPGGLAMEALVVERRLGEGPYFDDAPSLLSRSDTMLGATLPLRVMGGPTTLIRSILCRTVLSSTRFFVAGK